MQFSWSVFAAYIVDRNFLAAAFMTLWTAVAAQGIGIAAGALIALAQLSQVGPLRAAARAFVWYWRGTPPVVHLLLLYFGLPQLGIRLGVIEAGLIGLGFYASAYMAEIIRAGILAIDRGQIEAARSLGIGYWHTMGSIVFPQAARIALPPLGNEFNSMLRTTALLSFISFEELLRVTTVAISDTFRTVELYSVAALYYLTMTTAWNAIQAAIERRLAVGVAGEAARRAARAGLVARLFGRRAAPQAGIE